MKISKQERAIILILLVVIILSVGIFTAVWPTYSNIEASRNSLKKTESERDELMTTLQRETTIDDEIKEAYQKGKNLADAFYPDLTTEEADTIIRKFITNFSKSDAKKALKIEGISVSGLTTETLSVSIYSEQEVTYPLKDFANTNVTQQDEEKAPASEIEKLRAYKLNNMLALAASEPVTVGCVQLSFTASAENQATLHEFIDYINKGIYDETIVDIDGKPQRKATYLTGANFVMAEASKSGSTPTTPNVDDQTSATNTPAEVPTMDFSINLYCIEPVADPFAD